MSLISLCLFPLQLFFERNEEIFRSTVRRGSHPAVDAAYAEVQVGPIPPTTTVYSFGLVICSSLSFRETNKQNFNVSLLHV